MSEFFLSERRGAGGGPNSAVQRRRRGKGGGARTLAVQSQLLAEEASSVAERGKREGFCWARDLSSSLLRGTMGPVAAREEGEKD